MEGAGENPDQRGVLTNGRLCTAILTFQARRILWGDSGTLVMKATNHSVIGLVAVPQEEIHTRHHKPYQNPIGGNVTGPMGKALLVLFS